MEASHRMRSFSQRFFQQQGSNRVTDGGYERQQQIPGKVHTPTSLSPPAMTNGVVIQLTKVVAITTCTAVGA